jgi:hypothetical protein
MKFSKTIWLMFAIAFFISMASPKAYAGYASIFYNADTGVYGASMNYGDKRGAEMGALGECTNRSGRGYCKHAVTVWGRQCGALAVSGHGGWAGRGAGTREQAKYLALNECMEVTGRKCRIEASVCQK